MPSDVPGPGSRVRHPALQAAIDFSPLIYGIVGGMVAFNGGASLADGVAGTYIIWLGVRIARLQGQAGM